MKIAIFGGTFDPVHIGHTAVAEAILAQHMADRLIVLPAWEPPHKQSVRTPFEHRLRMAELAFAGVEGTEVSALESVWQFEPSYSIDVLGEFQQMFPDDEILMVIGGDSLKDFHRWYKPRELAERFDFIIYPRSGNDCDFSVLSEVIGEKAAQKMRSNVINAPFFEISSTILRKKLANCENTANFIAEEVFEYIKEKKLYRGKI